MTIDSAVPGPGVAPLAGDNEEERRKAPEGGTFSSAGG
jgi:hypothetical protein